MHLICKQTTHSILRVGTCAHHEIDRSVSRTDLRVGWRWFAIGNCCARRLVGVKTKIQLPGVIAKCTITREQVLVSSLYNDIIDDSAESYCFGLVALTRKVVCGLPTSEDSQALNSRQFSTLKLDSTSLQLPLPGAQQARNILALTSDT
jgi:hypothetical protein